ncbi:hypothetical protein V6Z11_D11G282500 [Gossypium hirsutum]
MGLAKFLYRNQKENRRKETFLKVGYCFLSLFFYCFFLIYLVLFFCFFFKKTTKINEEGEKGGLPGVAGASSEAKGRLSGGGSLTVATCGEGAKKKPSRESPLFPLCS